MNRTYNCRQLFEEAFENGERELSIICILQKYSSFCWLPFTDSGIKTNIIGMERSGKYEVKKKQFEPYDMNGGTVVAIAGRDYMIIAADTRLTQGYEILSRNVTRLHQLTDKCILGNAGCWTDMVTLNRTLDYAIKDYKYTNNEIMSCSAVAALLSNTLYNHRFFPIYAFNVLAGLDEEGHGVIYSYDAVGSYELLKYGVQGSAQSHIIPILDSCVAKRNRNVPYADLERNEAMSLIKESFTVATEREKDTGDSVEIMIISAAGVEKEVMKLRSD